MRNLKKVDKMQINQNGGKKKTEDESEEESDEDGNAEKRKRKEDNKESSSEEEDEEVSVKKAKTVSNPSGAKGSRVWIGNLSFNIDDEGIRSAFKKVGEILNVDWVTDKETGRFYGSGFLTFADEATAEKALSLDGTEVLGRPIRVQFTKERSENGGGKGAGKGRDSTPGEAPAGCTTIFLGNVSQEANDDDVHQFFGDCGTIKDIRWVNDKETGQFKGCGFIEFDSEDGPKSAISKNGQDLKGQSVRVDFSKSRDRDGGGGRGGRGGGRGGGGRGGGGRGGGRGFGRPSFSGKRTTF